MGALYVKVGADWVPIGLNGAGVGVPAGGALGAVLRKKSATDYDTEWSSLAPRGYVGQGVATISQSSVPNNTDITGATVTFTTDGTRRFRYSWKLRVTKDGTASPVWVEIMSEAGAVVDTSFQNMQASTELMFVGFTTEQPASGTHTRKLNIKMVSGQATITASAANKTIVLVEDIGGV